MYAVRGRNASTGAAAAVNDASFNFWNPHSTALIRLISLTVVTQDAGALNTWSGCLARTTARGTPGSTVTPDMSNDGKRGADPPSGALLDLANFSVEPTVVTDYMEPIYRGLAQRGVHHHHVFSGAGLYIPAGTGIALVQTTTANSPIFEISVYWLED